MQIIDTDLGAHVNAAISGETDTRTTRERSAERLRRRQGEVTRLELELGKSSCKHTADYKLWTGDIDWGLLSPTFEPPGTAGALFRFHSSFRYGGGMHHYHLKGGGFEPFILTKLAAVVIHFESSSYIQSKGTSVL